MDRNNNSDSSVCTKIRQALTSNAAVRAIRRISSYHQEPKLITFGSSSPSPAPTNTIPQQKVKANKEASSGAIPIKFDNSSTPIPPFVATNSRSAKTTTTTTKLAAKGETQPTQHVSTQGKPSTNIGQHGHHGVHSEQQGKKSIDINETFNEYIQRAKKKIRTVSNLSRGQNNPTPADHESHGHGATNKKEDHRDQFSEFIQRAKKKLRTTTFAGRSSSLRKG